MYSQYLILNQYIFKINFTILIKNLINKIYYIEIKSVGFWRMGAVYAGQYYKSNCILVGNAYHGMRHAGGFGMNTGIQMHKIQSTKLKNKKIYYIIKKKDNKLQKINRTALKFYKKIS
ncbi:unnamed protein product [Paramecium sonneborni]|uniref:FAD-binding domain-containing protein n=1 Tax=Paramecium sonneborni TaxID=65129 RepID=A0A8S1RS50_9CILI|nr:unnamed protein product [Paramecium sonneborni]